MKILFRNRALLSAVSATDESLNYPSENLQSGILKRRFQAYGNTSIVTFALDSTYGVNSLFLGWTNADTVKVTVSDFVETRTIIRASHDPFVKYEIEYDNTEVFYFPTKNVSTLTVELTTSESSVFCGGIGFGLISELPDVEAGWKRSFDDNSLVVESVGGQVSQNYVRPLTQFEFNFPFMNNSEWNAWQELYINCGRGKTVWCDFFEGNHAYQKPLYGYLLSVLEPSKIGNRFAFKMKFKESR